MHKRSLRINLESMALASSTWVLQAIQSIISDIDSIIEDSTVSVDRPEVLEWRIELVYRDLVAKEVSGELEVEEQLVLPLIAEACFHLGELVQNIELLPPPSSQPTQLLDGSVGRPRYNISYHLLETLIALYLSVPQIAQIVGVSVSTIRRRMNDYNLSIRSTYSTISEMSWMKLFESNSLAGGIVMCVAA